MKKAFKVKDFTATVILEATIEDSSMFGTTKKLAEEVALDTSLKAAFDKATNRALIKASEKLGSGECS